jgi:hypothetical protein
MDGSLSFSKLRGPERAAGHSDFVIRRQFGSDYSCFVVQRFTHLESSAAHDNDCSIQQEQTELVIGERYFAVHDGPVRCLFNSQCSAGKFRPLGHYS